MSLFEGLQVSRKKCERQTAFQDSTEAKNTIKRPTFYDLLDEQADFIGPPAPSVIPKFTAIDERKSAQEFYDNELAKKIAAENEAFSFENGD